MTSPTSSVNGDWMIDDHVAEPTSAAELGDEQRAGLLYELLAPYRDANVVIGLAAACLGRRRGTLVASPYDGPPDDAVSTSSGR